MLAILMSRFMLDLQAVDSRSRRLTSQIGTIDTATGHQSSIAFDRRVLGSVGSSVTADTYNDNVPDSDLYLAESETWMADIELEVSHSRE